MRHNRGNPETELCRNLTTFSSSLTLLQNFNNKPLENSARKIENYLPGYAECQLELDHIVAMLSRLGGRGYSVKEDSASYGTAEFDPDPDPDPDSEWGSYLFIGHS